MTPGATGLAVAWRAAVWRAAATVAVSAAIMLAAAGCASGSGSPTTGDSRRPPVAPSVPAGSLQATPVVTARPSPIEVAGPPQATIAELHGADGTPLTGALGTFSWDGLTSDAPWMVPSAGGEAAASTALSIAFAPDDDPLRWTAGWAPVTGGDVGDPVGAGAGAGTPVAVRAPDRAGTWSLQVVASFGDGRTGAWYWKVVVDR